MKRTYLTIITFVLMAFPGIVLADSGIWQADVYVNSSGSYNWYAGDANADGNTYLEGHHFGTFTSLDALQIKGGQVKTWKNNGSDVTGGYMYYAIYEQGNRPSDLNFNEIQFGNWTDLGESYGSINQRIYSDNLNIDMLEGLTSGTYVLEVFWKATSSDGDLFVSDAANNNFKATFTVATPGLSMSDDGLITEGQEDGEIITVDVSNDTFTATLNASNWSMSNLPAGVGLGSVNRVSDQQATVTLSGNSTEDYDANNTDASLQVEAAEFINSGSALSATSGVTFTAVIEDGDPLTLSDDGQILEGSEDGEIITVNLNTGATFADPLETSQVNVKNLPAGVSKGTVNRVDATTLEIALSGNAPGEYYSNINNLTVQVNASDIQGYTGDALSACTGVSMENTGAPLISSQPAFPTSEDPLIITFNAAKGNGALAGYSDSVFAHTGVTIDGNKWQSSSSWLDNADKYLLASTGNDTYELTINNIADYYNLTSGEADSVTALNFVLRNSDGSKQAKTVENEDINLPVFSEGLEAVFHTPGSRKILQAGEDLRIVAEANEAEQMALFIDGSAQYTTCGSRLESTIQAAQATGNHTIRVEASNGSETTSIEQTYFTRSDVEVQQLPEGVEDGINYISDSQVTLVLHAPYKEHIFVMGDFNNWELKDKYFMKRTHSNPDHTDNRYWITIDNLTPGQEYAFQYLIDGELQVADPYTEKVLDPHNDKYISDATYPSLRAYPEKGEGIVSTLKPGQTEYQWDVTDFQAEDQDQLVIYEMHLRDFTRDGKIGNLEQAMQKLDYLEALGVNAIELMPINEFEGNDSWGYNPSFYFATDKAYGTKKMYKKFIDEAHKRGMSVILDIVLNHSFFQSPMVKMYFNQEENRPAANNPWYNETHNFENGGLQWGADFDHESPYTVAFTDRVMEHWLTEFNVDGFRFDFTKGFSNNWKSIAYDEWGSNYDGDRIANLKDIYGMMKSYNSDALMICEHLAENAEEKELANYGMLMWGNMEHNYAEMAFGNTGSGANVGSADYKSRDFAYPNLVPYMESHDEQRINYKLGAYSSFTHNQRLDRIAMAASFYVPLKGPRMLWQFQELGYDISIDENGRTGKKPVLWDYFDNADRRDLFEYFSLMNNAKSNNDVFRSDDYDFNVNAENGYGQMKGLAMYTANGNDVVIIGNTSATETGYITPNFSETGTWHDVTNGGTIQVNDLSNAFMLQPGEFRIYSLNPLKLDVFWTGMGADNNWNNAENWNIGQVPNTVADVIIPDSATVTVASDNEAVCENLNVRPNATVYVESSANLNVSGTTTLEEDETGKGEVVYNKSAQKTTSVKSVDGQNLRIFGHGKTIHIAAKTTTDARIRVFNMTGQQIMDRQASWRGVKRLPMKAQPGVYIVQVKSEQGISTAKVSIR